MINQYKTKLQTCTFKCKLNILIIGYNRDINNNVIMLFMSLVTITFSHGLPTLLVLGRIITSISAI